MPQWNTKNTIAYKEAQPDQPRYIDRSLIGPKTVLNLNFHCTDAAHAVHSIMVKVPEI
jgi:hypothetical protein